MKNIVAVMLMLMPLGLMAAEVTEDPLERRMLRIAKELRCTVCQNQPVSESNSDLARDMRAIINEQIKAGKSDAEIKQYFVDRYGNYVLMKPPLDMTGSFIWLTPLVIFVVLAAGGMIFLRNRHREPKAVATLSEADQARIRAARAKSITDQDNQGSL